MIPILAGLTRYWQRRPDSILASLRPILAGLAILAASLACSGPAWAVSTPTPAPILAKDSIPSPAPAVSTQAKTPAPIRAAVSALQSLNVREKATKQSRSLGILYKGDSVTLTGECKQGSRWARIEYKDGLAWVDAHYLSGHICEEE